jgi:hypothetical protein
MILTLQDDGCIHVYDDIDAVVLQVEALDAEGTLRAVFDENGQRFGIRWLTPNRTSRVFLGSAMVENGRYTLEPVGPQDPNALLALLEQPHPVLPAARERDVSRLRRSLSAS